MKPIEALMRYEENPYNDQAFDVVHDALKEFERLKEWAKERMSLGYFVRVDHVDVPTGKILITHAGGFDDAIAAICKESEDKP